MSEIGAVVRPYLDIRAWLRGELGFQGWLDKLERLNSKQVVGRCFTLWREGVGEIQWVRQLGMGGLSVLRETCYLRQTLFNRSCRSGRLVTANLVQYFIDNSPHQMKKELVDSLADMLDEVGEAGTASQEFLGLFSKLVSMSDWKYYLCGRGVLQRLASLMSRQIEQLGEREERGRASGDLAMGFAVKEETRAFIAVCDATVG